MPTDYGGGLSDSQGSSSPSSMGGVDASAAGVSGGAFGMAGTIISAVAQYKANQKSMAYQDQWANQQRDWAVADRDYNNWYNSPAQQRIRMIAGGINPALMYGSGTTNQPSALVRSTPSPTATYDAPDLRGLGTSAMQGLSMYYSVLMQKAQVEHMNIQNQQLESSATLNTSRANLTDAENQKLQMWLDAAHEFADSSGSVNDQGHQTGYYESDMLRSQQIKSFQATLLGDENGRRALYSAKNADEVVARIGLIQSQQAHTDADKQRIDQATELLRKSNILQQFSVNGESLLQGYLSGDSGKLLFGLLKSSGIIK